MPPASGSPPLRSRPACGGAGTPRQQRVEKLAGAQLAPEIDVRARRQAGDEARLARHHAHQSPQDVGAGVEGSIATVEGALESLLVETVGDEDEVHRVHALPILAERTVLVHGGIGRRSRVGSELGDLTEVELDAAQEGLGLRQAVDALGGMAEHEEAAGANAGGARQAQRLVQARQRAPRV